MKALCPATVARASATITTNKLSLISNLLAPVCQAPLAEISPETSPAPTNEKNGLSAAPGGYRS